MFIFYDKHYRKTTPLWLHYLVMGGIAVKGGVALAPELFRRRELNGQSGRAEI
jgi:hypothetical protein